MNAMTKMATTKVVIRNTSLTWTVHINWNLRSLSKPSVTFSKSIRTSSSRDHRFAANNDFDLVFDKKTENTHRKVASLYMCIIASKRHAWQENTTISVSCLFSSVPSLLVITNLPFLSNSIIGKRTNKSNVLNEEIILTDCFEWNLCNCK